MLNIGFERKEEQAKMIEAQETFLSNGAEKGMTSDELYLNAIH